MNNVYNLDQEFNRSKYLPGERLTIGSLGCDDKIIHQHIKGNIKTTTIHSLKSHNLYSYVMQASKDSFTSRAYKHWVLIREYTAKSPNRKFLTGFKGFIEKLAWQLANDKNGFERVNMPSLLKLSGSILNKIRH